MSLLSITFGLEKFSPTYKTISPADKTREEKREEQEALARKATEKKRAASDAACKAAFAGYLRSAKDIAQILGIHESTAHSKLLTLANRNKVQMVGKYMSADGKRYIFMWSWISD